ncbi:MAG: hypothetical protein ABEH43_07015, partial [Flavobacteriales bacterium]
DTINGCSKSSDTTTIYTDSLDLSTPSDTVKCSNDTIKRSLSSNIDFTSYQWKPDSTLDCDSCELVKAFPEDSTVYTIIASNGTCVNDTDSIELNILPNPVADAGNDTTMCQGKSVQLNGTNADSVFWSPKNGLDDRTITNPTASPITTTDYELFISDTNGCNDRDTVQVTVNGTNILATTNKDTMCQVDTAQLNALNGSFTDNFDPRNIGLWEKILGGTENTKCGSVSDSSLYFNGDNKRLAQTIPLNVTSCSKVNFCIKLGEGTTPCEKVD